MRLLLWIAFSVGSINNFVAPNINFENPDEHSEKLNLAVKTIDTEINTVLSNSFGFGGTNSALVVKKFKP